MPAMTCPGPKWLVLVVILMCLGYIAILIGLFLPYWQEGRGYDVGLFYDCKDEVCTCQDITGDTLSLTIALLIIGLIIMCIGLMLAFVHLRRKHTGLKMTAYTTVGVPLFTITGAFLVLVGVLIYCTGVYDKDSEYTLNESPWIVVFGAALNGICSLLFLLMAKCNNFQVDTLDGGKKEIYGGKHQGKEPESSYWDDDSLEETETEKKRKKKNFLRKKAEDRKKLKEDADTSEESLDETRKDDGKLEGNVMVDVVIKQDKATQTKGRKGWLKGRDSDDSGKDENDKETMKPLGKGDDDSKKPKKSVGTQTRNDDPARVPGNDDGDGADDGKEKRKSIDKGSAKERDPYAHRCENKEKYKEREEEKNSERGRWEKENSQQQLEGGGGDVLPGRDGETGLPQGDKQINFDNPDQDGDTNNEGSNDSGNESGINADKDSNEHPSGDSSVPDSDVGLVVVNGYQASLPLTWVWRKRNTSTILGHRVHLHSKEPKSPFTKAPWH